MLTCSKYSNSHRAAPFFGRLFIASLFLIAALGLFVDFQGGVASLEQVGFQHTGLLIVLAICMQGIGSLLLILGLFTRVACWLLIIFLVPLTFLFHSFWLMQGAQQALQFSLFLKNISVLGGLLVLESFGPGKWSIDALRAKPSPHS